MKKQKLNTTTDKNNFLRLTEKSKTFPREPGCYMFLDKQKKVIYVGKAKNLRNRVTSYFSGFTNLEERKKLMIEESSNIEYITLDSEMEAIILETNLIKKYQPKYNILMRDDKSYNWILVESKKENDFPRIKIIRDIHKKNYKGDFFGPFNDSVPLKNLLRRLRKIFPYASCNRTIEEISSNPLKIKSSDSNPCLYYHIGLCPAPCAGKISKKEYYKNIQEIKKFLLGKKNEIIKKLETEMNKHSKLLEFEKAKEIRDRINEIKYVTTKIKIDSNVDDVAIKDIKEQEKNLALSNLLEKIGYPFKDFDKNSFKIECYDISNIQGKYAVGAMVVSIGGYLKPDLYRRFRIKIKQTPNDFAMMQEVLLRRFLKYKNTEQHDTSFSILPNLIIIDGGKGQLSASFEILKKLNLHTKIPIIALAKKEEEIFKFTYQFFEQAPIESDDMFTRILLKKNSEELFLIQRIRDETHRFAISYHRKLRSKEFTKVS